MAESLAEALEHVDGLERALQEYAELEAGERATRFARGDIVMAVIKANAGRISRNQVYKAFAQVGKCTANYVRQLTEVAATWIGDTRRAVMDENWAVLRACMYAARRLRRDPHELLAEALKNGWHAGHLVSLGSVNRGSTLCTLSATCQGCGIHVTIRASFPSEFALPCPFCVRRAWEDGQNGRSVEYLGVIA